MFYTSLQLGEDSIISEQKNTFWAERDFSVRWEGFLEDVLEYLLLTSKHLECDISKNVLRESEEGENKGRLRVVPSKLKEIFHINNDPCVHKLLDVKWWEMPDGPFVKAENGEVFLTRDVKVKGGVGESRKGMEKRKGGDVIHFESEEIPG